LGAWSVKWAEFDGCIVGDACLTTHRETRYCRQMTKTTSTSFRLSLDARRLLAKLAKRLGISQAAILELAVRKLDRETKDN
jgi:hypothetical protein